MQSLSPHCFHTLCWGEDDDYDQRVSEYVQEMPQSQITDQSMGLGGRDIEH